MELRRDPESGIETIRAHFDGHAYEPHDHDDVLVGVTEQGLQQFRSRRAVHTSTPGRAILIEPGEVHDGRSAGADGFTYAMLYLPYARVAARVGDGEGSRRGFGFRSTLDDDPALCAAIRAAFLALHRREGRLARDVALERLYAQLLGHVAPPPARDGRGARPGRRRGRVRRSEPPRAVVPPGLRAHPGGVRADLHGRSRPGALGAAARTREEPRVRHEGRADHPS